MRFLLLLLFLTSCATSEASRHDRLIVSVSEQTWLQETRLPNPGNCLKNISVVTLSKENFRKTCGLASFLSSGCIREKGAGNFRPGKVLYLSPSVNKNQAIVKMTLHALAECTSYQEDKYDNAEFRPYIWFRTSGEDSVEAKAYENTKKYEGK